MRYTVYTVIVLFNHLPFNCHLNGANRLVCGSRSPVMEDAMCLRKPGENKQQPYSIHKHTWKKNNNKIQVTNADGGPSGWKYLKMLFQGNFVNPYLRRIFHNFLTHNMILKNLGTKFTRENNFSWKQRHFLKKEKLLGGGGGDFPLGPSWARNDRVSGRTAKRLAKLNVGRALSQICGWFQKLGQEHHNSRSGCNRSAGERNDRLDRPGFEELFQNFEWSADQEAHIFWAKKHIIIMGEGAAVALCILNSTVALNHTSWAFNPSHVALLPCIPEMMQIIIKIKTTILERTRARGQKDRQAGWKGDNSGINKDGESVTRQWAQRCWGEGRLAGRHNVKGCACVPLAHKLTHFYRCVLL